MTADSTKTKEPVVASVRSLNRDKLDTNLQLLLKELSELADGSVVHEMAKRLFDLIVGLLLSLRGTDADIQNAAMSLVIFLEALSQSFDVPLATGDAPSTTDVHAACAANAASAERAFEMRIAKFRERVEELLREVASLREAEEKAAQADARAQSLMHQVTKLSKQNTRLEGDLAESGKELAALRNQRANANLRDEQRVLELEAQIRAKEAAIGSSRQNIETLEKEIEGLRAVAADTTELQRQITVLTERNAEVEVAARVTAQDILSGMDAYVATLARVLVAPAPAAPRIAVTPDPASISTEADRIESHLGELQQALSATTERMSELDRNIQGAELNARIGNAPEKAKALRELPCLRKHMEQLHAHRDRLAELAQEAGASNNVLRRYLHALETVQKGVDLEIGARLAPIPAIPDLEPVVGTTSVPPVAAADPPTTTVDAQTDDPIVAFERLARQHGLSLHGAVLATLYEMLPPGTSFTKHKQSGLARVKRAVDRSPGMEWVGDLPFWEDVIKNGLYPSANAGPEAERLKEWLRFGGLPDKAHAFIFFRSDTPLPWEVSELFSAEVRSEFVRSFSAAAPPRR